MKRKENRGYGIIEPPIYESLKNNNDLLISCLEIIRTKLPKILSEIPTSIKYEILMLENPFGKAYPVIGYFTNTPKDLDEIPDCFDFDEKVEKWLNKNGFINLKNEALNLI